jgi:hypothetical protein
MTLRTTIQDAATVYTVTSRYYASYLSHTVEYINWILMTCSVQIIAVFSPEHSFVYSTLFKVLYGHVRLYTNFPLKRLWLCVHRSSVYVSVYCPCLCDSCCVNGLRVFCEHITLFIWVKKLVFYIPYEEARTNSEEWHYSTTFVDILGFYV